MKRRRPVPKFIIHHSALVLLLSAFSCAAAPGLRLAAFHCDITPPLGEPMVWATKLVKVEAPLQAKGVLLQSGTNRYILCALDWCLLANESQASFRRALARGANT